MKIAIYTRCSTDKQETENQAVQLRESAAKQNWQIVREYCDYDSGSKADRYQFQQMFTDASRRKFDLVPRICIPVSCSCSTKARGRAKPKGLCGRRLTWSEPSTCRMRLETKLVTPSSVPLPTPCSRH